MFLKEINVKKFYLFFLFSFFCVVVYSQSVERYTISSMGGSYFDGANFSMDYTSGQVVTSTISTPINFLTQGFQQPFTNKLSFIEEHTENMEAVYVYPNPAVNTFTIKVRGIKHTTFDISIYDLLGQLLIQQSGNADKDGNGQFEIDIEKLATGNYFVRITQDAILIKTKKIIKINQ